MSTCAYQDGDDVIGHVVFSVAPVDDPIEELTGSAEYGCREKDLRMNALI